MENPIVVPSNVEKARKRLFLRKRRLGSYGLVARACQVNVSYVYQFIKRGTVPANPRIQRALGIHPHRPVTINSLLNLPIQDMPAEILRLAFEQREEM